MDLIANSVDKQEAQLSQNAPSYQWEPLASSDVIPQQPISDNYMLEEQPISRQLEEDLESTNEIAASNQVKRGEEEQIVDDETEEKEVEKEEEEEEKEEKSQLKENEKEPVVSKRKYFILYFA